MKLFEDETASKMKGSFDLRLWTMENVVKSESTSSWRITMTTNDGSIRFGFQSAAESNEVMEWMKRFLLDQDLEAKEEDTRSSQHGVISNVIP